MAKKQKYTAKQIVRITIEGGVIQNIYVPPGLLVVVKDYDEEGMIDSNGDRYAESRWENEGDRQRRLKEVKRVN